MGLILGDEAKGEAPVVLTDILGSEDALGDMDFKIAGDAEGLTAFQLDIKVEGITLPVMRTALESAHVGLIHILGEMEKADPPPGGEMSKYAPQIETLTVSRSTSAASSARARSRSRASASRPRSTPSTSTTMALLF